MLAYPSVALEASHAVQQDWIADPFHRKVLTAIGELAREQRSITVETVATRMRLSDSALGEAKTLERLTNLRGKGNQTSASDWKSAIDDTHAAYTRQKVLDACRKIEVEINKAPTASEVVEAATSTLLSSLPNSEQRHDSIDSQQLVPDWVAQRTGEQNYIEYDQVLSSHSNQLKVRPSTITVFGALSGAGKSWWLCDSINLYAGKHNLRTAVFSMEMSSDELLERLVIQGGYKRHELHPDNFDYEYMCKRLEEIKEMPFDIFEYSADIPRMRSALVRAEAQGNPFKAMMVDHLHLMKLTDRFGAQEVMAEFREMANRFGLVMLLLCQLRKPPTDTSWERYRPRAADIRDFSSIPEIADFVFMLKRDRGEDNEQEPPTGWLFTEKVRKGKKFPAERIWLNPRNARFETYTTGAMVNR